MAAVPDRVAVLAVLAEPVRRRVYDHVVASGHAPVSRDGAARALGVPRSVAAFHLDKLVEAGLLVAEYHRPTGRGGPGAGRPTKWYRRGDQEIAVTVPERRYGLAAALLARAVERSARDAMPVTRALCDVAREEGHRIGAALRPGGAEPGGTEPGGTGASGTGASGAAVGTVRARLVQVLAENGYEPRAEGPLVTLANCPFHLLTEEHRDLVCTMNHELISGVADQAGLPRDATRLDPGKGRCCVTITV
ncbi:MAG TPA: helix-turn-helix domain-containing protein [Acidimicrobiales bacterium]|nr:helix-turn-helix domain-containing protein [Acidimicrobiales bacterium]